MTAAPAARAGTVADLLREVGDGVGDPQVSFRTGFAVLDGVIEDGFRCGDLVLVGGGPGVGKTVATLQWARNVAQSGAPVTYVCYEHSRRALLSRLILLEAASLPKAGGHGDTRRLVKDVAAGRRSLDQAAAADLRFRAALDSLSRYAGLLTIVQAGAETGVAALDELAVQLDGAGVLFIDYLQKIPEHGSPTEAKQIRGVGESLKGIAMSRNVVVVAISAGDGSSLTQRRMRIHDLRGAEALAYEADVVIVLNEKLGAVSRLHSAYDPVKTHLFRRQVVFTIEKNRDGLAPVDVQFIKDFQHYRFEPEGSAVEEQLVDGVVRD